MKDEIEIKVDFETIKVHILKNVL